MKLRLGKRVTVIAIITLVLIVVMPPLAGILFLVLQLLGDPSYDLSRFGISDLPRAALGVFLSGSVYGYLFGLFPALAASAAVAWLVAMGRTLSLPLVLICVFLGGSLGALLASPIVGVVQAMGIVVLMIGVVAAAWPIVRLSGLLEAEVSG